MGSLYFPPLTHFINFILLEQKYKKLYFFLKNIESLDISSPISYYLKKFANYQIGVSNFDNEGVDTTLLIVPQILILYAQNQCSSICI